MSALDLASLSGAEKALAGRVVIQVLNDLRYLITQDAQIDVTTLNEYEGVKLDSIKIRELEGPSRRSMPAEGSKQ